MDAHACPVEDNSANKPHFTRITCAELKQVLNATLEHAEAMHYTMHMSSINAVVDNIYRTGQVADASGVTYPLQSSVGRAEGQYLFDLVASNNSIKTTLEVGCAFGLSSLAICEGLRGRDGAKHTIIDPSQMAEWHGVGLNQLDLAGLDMYEFIEEPSEVALPNLLQRSERQYDLIFIDGWHTFDHTLIDLFFANRLLKVGGYIVVDDCNWASVSKAVSYVEQYPAYTRVGGLAVAQGWRQRLAKAFRKTFPSSLARFLPLVVHDYLYARLRYPSMVTLQKIDSDSRSWSWFASF